MKATVLFRPGGRIRLKQLEPELHPSRLAPETILAALEEHTEEGWVEIGVVPAGDKIWVFYRRAA